MGVDIARRWSAHWDPVLCINAHSKPLAEVAVLVVSQDPLATECHMFMLASSPEPRGIPRMTFCDGHEATVAATSLQLCHIKVNSRFATVVYPRRRVAVASFQSFEGTCSCQAKHYRQIARIERDVAAFPRFSHNPEARDALECYGQGCPVQAWPALARPAEVYA